MNGGLPNNLHCLYYGVVYNFLLCKVYQVLKKVDLFILHDWEVSPSCKGKNQDRMFARRSAKQNSSLSLGMNNKMFNKRHAFYINFKYFNTLKMPEVYA